MGQIKKVEHIKVRFIIVTCVEIGSWNTGVLRLVLCYAYLSVRKVTVTIAHILGDALFLYIYTIIYML